MTFPRLLVLVLILWIESSDTQTSALAHTSAGIQTSPGIQNCPEMQTTPGLQNYRASHPSGHPPKLCCPLHSNDRAINNNNNNNSSNLVINPQLQPHPSIGLYSEAAADDMSANNHGERETTASFDVKSPPWVHISATISDGKLDCGTQCVSAKPVFIFRGEVWSLAISYQQVTDLILYLENMVFPLIAVVGITGSVISLCVLTKSGLGKPSNILLFLLSTSDILILQNRISLSDLLYLMINSRELPDNVAFFLSALKTVTDTLDGVSNKAGSYIILWVTVERLVAIFFPLHFKSVVTARRVWTLGVMTFIIPCVWVLYTIIINQITKYDFYPNRTVRFRGVISSEKLGKERIYVAQTFMYTLPLVLVLLGCVVIAVKLSLTQRKRLLLSLHSGMHKSRNRTTKTLLLVSFCYLMTRFLILYNYAEPVLHGGMTLVIMVIIGEFQILTLSLGAASDCAVFIFYNSKFRAIFSQMFKLHPRIRNIPRCSQLT